MLKDRRVLLEQEIKTQKRLCGDLYKKIIVFRGDNTELNMLSSMYGSMKIKLSDAIIELGIINQMIEDGHE